MNGPEHYGEAEKCLEQARGVDFDHAAFLHREAQVHATLALAAATVAPRGEWHEADGQRSNSYCEDPAWIEVSQ